MAWRSNTAIRLCSVDTILIDILYVYYIYIFPKILLKCFIWFCYILVESDLMTDTVPFNLASSGEFEDWPVTWYPELMWWPWHPQSVKLNWPNLFKYHEGDLTCGSTIETILHHVGCIEPCKTDRQKQPKRMDGLWSRIWGRQVSPLSRERHGPGWLLFTRLLIIEVKQRQIRSILHSLSLTLPDIG